MHFLGFPFKLLDFLFSFYFLIFLLTHLDHKKQIEIKKNKTTILTGDKQ